MIKVQIINKGHQPLPAFATPQSAGMDLRANIDEAIVLHPMECRLVPTGLYMALPAGYEAQIRPRSGLALQYGITVLNTPGTIDADYRGEMNAYMGLSPTMKLFGTAINYGFGDVEETGILIAVDEILEDKRVRYINTF